MSPAIPTDWDEGSGQAREPSIPGVADSSGIDAARMPDWRTHHFPGLARIDESRCIGCMLCIRACPVDAIVGTARRMHTVLAAECTGCGLCLPPCPMDCIALLPPPSPRTWTAADALQAENRTQARRQRIARERQEPTPHRAAATDGSSIVQDPAQDPTEDPAKNPTIRADESRQGRRILQQAIERARNRARERTSTHRTTP